MADGEADRGAWLRHRGGTARLYSAKDAATWMLDDGTRLRDGSGGTLLQSLTGLVPPPARCFGNIAPSSGFETPRQAALARRIERRHLADGYALTWTASGSDGNELALWLLTRGRAAAGRPRFLVGQGGYHGATGLLRQLSTRLPPSPGPLLGEVETLVLPVFAGAGADARFAEARAWFESIGLGPRDILVLETVPTTGPGFAPDWPFLERLLGFVRGRGGQVLLDEVACGAFRHGWFSSLARGLRPDALVVGKGLTCGTVPCTAVIVGDAVVDRVRGSGEKVAGFTITLTDIAADLVGQTLDRYEALAADGWFERRGRACAALAEAARALGPAACEATATSLRWSTGDASWFARLQRSAAEHDLFLYASSCPIAGEQRHFALYCPAFDLPEAEIEALDRTMLAVVGEAGA
jgi:adenosylmethionine-8-amino-7-oxononanoate aminotransferase